MPAAWPAARIRRELEGRGVTIAELARRAGISRTTAARRLETPPPKLATAISRALHTKREIVWPGVYGAKSHMGAIAAQSPYEGATIGPRLNYWGLAGIGPNAAVAFSAGNLRARSREVARNNAWVRKAVESYVSNVIGTGIMPRWQLPDAPALKEQIQKTFARWTDEADAAAATRLPEDGGQLDFYGLQGLVAQTFFLAGECLIRFRPRLPDDGLTVPLQLQVLEPDHLDEARDGLQPNGNVIRFGIEFNRLGQRSAYWLRREHPGDLLPMSGNGASFESVPIPADQVIHVYLPERPGQIRGIPRLASVLLRLFEFDHYEDAELVRKKAAALIGGFIIDNTPDTVPFGRDLGRDRAGQRLMGLEPGTFPVLRPGQDVKFSTPADVGGSYAEWTRQQLRAIAAGAGITYEQLTGDLSGVNYSSIRAGLVEVRRSLERLIWTVFVFQLCRRVVRKWMDFAVAAGALAIPDYNRNRARYLDVAWRPQRWPWVDPLKDVLAEKAAVRAGFKSRSAVVSELGDDAEAVDREIAEDNRRADDQDLVFDSDPRRTGGSGAGQPVGTTIDEALREDA